MMDDQYKYESEKICPLNPHGNGYCQKEKCMLWCRWTQTNSGRKEVINDDCAINTIAWELSVLESRI